MKRLITWLGLICIFAGVYIGREELSRYFYELLRGNTNVVLEYSNKYTREHNYDFLKTTTKFDVENKTELLNVYYTILNSGIDEFSFFCNKKYKECINDVIYMNNHQEYLSSINSYVHPYNSFQSIETVYDTLGKVTLKIVKAYTKEQINEIEKKVQEIIDNKIKNTTDKKEIIKIVHDYIIENTKYDSDRSDKNIIKYASNIAYGPLLEGFAICGGYTDAMAIFLDRYNIPNISITSEEHIWNGVYINNKWYHLDLTWDDPIVSDGRQILDYTYFLISTKDLLEHEKLQHNFNKSVFPEFAN